MLFLIILVLVVGAFYNIGKSRTKFQGYLWAVSSLLLWITTNLTLNLLGQSGTIIRLVTLLSLQLLLLIIEMRYAERFMNKKLNLSIGKIEYAPFNNSIDILYFITDNSEFELTFLLKNSTGEIEESGDLVGSVVDNNTLSIHSSNLKPDSYSIEFYENGKLSESKEFYFDNVIGVKMS